MALLPEWEPAELAPARDSLRGVSHILYLCLGNICRSPFAQRRTERELASRNITGVTVESAGLRTTDGRASPDVAISVADEYGVDLDSHRSTAVEPADIARTDVVFIMDLTNYWLLRRMDTTESDPYLFGLFDHESSPEIIDPYGGSPAVFRRVYGRIDRAVSRMVDEIESERESSKH